MSVRSKAGAVLLSVWAVACTSPGEMPWGGRWGVADDPGLSLHSVSGPELRSTIRSASAKLVVVNVWATWCLSCREELPALVRLRRFYGSRGVAVVIVSGDFASERDGALAALKSADVEFPTYIKSGKDMEFINALHPAWSGALPASFLYADGELVDWWEGAATYGDFAAAVEAALAGGAGGPAGGSK